MRNVLWLFLALLVPPAAPAVWATLTTHLTEEPKPDWPLLPIFYAYAFLAVAILGLPAAIFARKVRVATWWAAMLWGCAVSAAFVPYRGQQLAQVLSFIAIGGATGYLFWAFGRRVC